MDHHDFVPCDVLPYSLKWFNYLSNITLYPIERVQKTAVTLKFCRRRRKKFWEKRSETQAIEQIAVRCVEYLRDNRLIGRLLINLIDCCGRFFGSVRYFLCRFFAVNIRFAFFRQVYGDSISDLIFRPDKSVLILKTTKIRGISGENAISRDKNECKSANNSNSFNQQIELFRE